MIIRWTVITIKDVNPDLTQGHSPEGAARAPSDPPPGDRGIKASPRPPGPKFTNRAKLNGPKKGAPQKAKSQKRKRGPQKARGGREGAELAL